MTVNALTQEARHEQALQSYLQESPQLAEEIKDLSADDQKDQIQWAFEDEAESQGLQPWELTLKYTSTPEEFEAARLVLHKEAAEVLGVEWQEYCEMNNLVVLRQIQASSSKLQVKADPLAACCLPLVTAPQRLKRIDRSIAFTSLVSAPIEM